MMYLRIYFKILAFSLLILFIYNQSAETQISHGGNPFGAARIRKAVSDIPIIDLNINTDSLRSKNMIREGSLTKQLKIGQLQTVNLNPENSGRWDSLDNGVKLWRLGIRSSGAFALAVFFSKFNLHDGVKLFIYNKDLTSIKGAFTDQNNNSSGILPVAPLDGDLIYIEMQLAKNSKNYGQISIDKVAHIYVDIFRNQELLKDNRFDLSGKCNIDINCFMENELMQQLKDAVCRFTYPEGGGFYLCTGTLMNTIQQKGIPYLLTANHCLSSNYASQNAVFVFEYESPFCHGPDGSIQKSIAGAQLIATNPNLDFSLVELNDTIPLFYHPYFAGWNVQENNIESTFTIHHPEGDVKKVSIYDNTPSTASYPNDYLSHTHWFIDQWTAGVTEGGSSGCPLFNQNGQVIGDLSGGMATCIFPYQDYFQKISASWNTFQPEDQRLDVWLSPGTSAIKEINGFDPYVEYKKTCDTLSNFNGSIPELLNFTGGGYWSGHNAGGFIDFAEKYSITQPAKLYGVYVNVAKAYQSNYESTVTFRVWNGLHEPNEVIAERTFPIYYFESNKVNYIEFNNVVDVPEDFYIGFEIDYFFNDTFAVYQADNAIRNTLSIGNGSTWSNFNDVYTENKWSGLCIMPVVCGASIDTSVTPDVKIKTLYPNPTTGKIFFNYNDYSLKLLELKVYDLSGRLAYISKKILVTDAFEADLSHLGNGIYIVQLVENNKVILTDKLVLIKTY